MSVRAAGLIDTVGAELVGIVTPVTVCMFIVVALVSTLNLDSSSSSPYVSTIATIAYTETSSDSSWDKFKGALLNSLVFVSLVTIATFVLVLLFYLRFTRFLKLYMAFSAFTVLGFLGGQVAILLIEKLEIPIDCFTFSILLYNFAAVGVMSVFMSNMAILVNQAYLVAIGLLVAYWFTLLPEWTTWVLLVAMAFYDLAAVLLPGGPLRLLVELAISRDEDIPALVYEARPVTSHDLDSMRGVVQMRVWKENHGSAVSGHVVVDGECSRNLEEGRATEVESEDSVPLINCRENGQSQVQPSAVGSECGPAVDGIGLGSSGAIKLGLGDFIFYSVLVGRAAMYDLMTVYACYLAIIAGLGTTLMLLSVYRKALPALPVSVLLGVLIYFLTRGFLEAFVQQFSLNLLMF